MVGGLNFRLTFRFLFMLRFLFTLGFGLVFKTRLTFAFRLTFKFLLTFAFSGPIPPRLTVYERLPCSVLWKVPRVTDEPYCWRSVAFWNPTVPR
jgi:hypothetical protein